MTTITINNKTDVREIPFTSSDCQKINPDTAYIIQGGLLDHMKDNGVTADELLYAIDEAKKGHEVMLSYQAQKISGQEFTATYKITVLPIKDRAGVNMLRFEQNLGTANLWNAYFCVPVSA